MGALTFNAVTVSLSTDVGNVCDLIQFCKKHLWLFQVQQETMSYHTHHVHHGWEVINKKFAKEAGVCVYVCVKKHLSETEIIMDLLSSILKSSAQRKFVLSWFP